MRLEQELGRLRVADEHIARVQSLIQLQLEAVHELKRNGRDAGPAIRLLKEMRASLEAIVRHRAVIEGLRQ